MAKRHRHRCVDNIELTVSFNTISIGNHINVIMGLGVVKNFDIPAKNAPKINDHKINEPKVEAKSVSRAIPKASSPEDILLEKIKMVGERLGKMQDVPITLTTDDENLFDALRRLHGHLRINGYNEQDVTLQHFDATIAKAFEGRNLDIRSLQSLSPNDAHNESDQLSDLMASAERLSRIRLNKIKNTQHPVFA